MTWRHREIVSQRSGFKVEDFWATMILARSLPPSYGNVLANLLVGLDLATAKPQDLIPKIIDEESRHKGESIGTSLPGHPQRPLWQMRKGRPYH